MRAAQLVRTNRCLRARIMEEVGVIEEASDGDGAPPLLNQTRPHQYPASVLGPTIEFALRLAKSQACSRAVVGKSQTQVASGSQVEAGKHHPFLHSKLSCSQCSPIWHALNHAQDSRGNWHEYAE